MQGFPDVELALCELLESLGPTGTATNEDLSIPIRVNRTGGASTPFEDHAVVEVTSWRSTRGESSALSQQISAALNDARAVATGAGFIDKISNTTAPMPLPDFNPDTRRVSSTWTVTSRLQEIEDAPSP